jgi:predicted Zn-dependent protease
MHFVLCLFFISFASLAHQTSLSSGGRELFWANTSIPVAINTNTTDMSAANVRTIVQNSMAQWNQYTSAKVNAVSSSSNEIRFVSNFPYGSGVIGVTETSYNSAGAIQRAVISLNDDYYFYSTEGFYGPKQVFLGDVVTHELGHLFGLSHSEVLNSTMFYSNFSGQSTVALDDRSGIRQKYEHIYGTITGQVQGGSHIGVLGVHVQAISRRTGESSGAISDEAGNFTLGGLDLNDTYYLYTSPIKNTDSLPGYYSNTQDSFCPATYLGSFFSGCGRALDGKPQGINLTSSLPTVDVGIVSINCSLRSDENYTYQKLQSSFAPVIMFDYGVEQKYEKSFVGWFRKTTSTTWSISDLLTVDLTGFSELSGTAKYLKISLVSYPFGNQLEYLMSVKKNSLAVSSASRGLMGPYSNGTYNTDFSALIALGSVQSENIFEIDLRSRKLSSTLIAQTFPSSLEFTTDQHLPYLLMTTIWEMTPQGLAPMLDTASNLSDNNSCLDAPFTYAVAQTKSKSESSASSADSVAAAAGCGTIEPPKNGPPSSMPLMALGFLLAFMASSLIKSRKKFLS